MALQHDIVRAMRCVGLLGAVLVASLADAPSAQAQAAARVAPVLARVLAYDRTLTARAGSEVDVVIAHTGLSSASGAQGRALSTAFERLGQQTVQGLPLRVHLVDVSGGLAGLPAGTDVIVACDGMPSSTTSALFAHARARRLLLVALSRAGLEHGAVAIFMEDGRPRIVTKMRHVQDSGIQLASPLLRLAEVI
ncbi:MAG: YfiR/HmsC family protein [Polyangiales bacterium]|nr:DUF4154 domain-containing protein [Myxococcales bacterium]MCB9656307.1 DUF4154 domain-containing protein [Sandaracinaceae bacterium]